MTEQMPTLPAELEARLTAQVTENLQYGQVTATEETKQVDREFLASM